MRNIGFMMAVILISSAACSAQSAAVPLSVNVRYSEQISNGPAGFCGCFSMAGVAGDVAWEIHRFGGEQPAGFIGGVADISVEHTGSVSGAPYGLTLTTLAFGPRYQFPAGKTAIFAQSLFGFTYGSSSAFPAHNTMEPSATSLAVDLGTGVDIPFKNRRFSCRALQLEYLHTDLPNNSTNWQNNLRISAGFTIHFR
jgi:hypothetical protein